MQETLLGLGCDWTTSMAAEWGGWTWNGALESSDRNLDFLSFELADIFKSMGVFYY